MILWMLGGPTTIIPASKCISHEKSMDIQIRNKRTSKPKINEPSIEIRNQRLLSSTRSALLRELRSSCLLHNVAFTLRTHKHSKLPVLQYDVSVAFIQSKLDSNHPPVYCECAEGYEDRRKYVYRLHRHLYGMKDRPRGLGQLFASVCTDFGLTRLKSDECVFVKFVNNSKTRIQNVQPNLANIVEATALVPENDRIYWDCPHATAILIIASYVDDNLAFTNCAALTTEFEVHCHVKFPMNAEDPSTGIYPSNTTVIQL